MIASLVSRLAVVRGAARTSCKRAFGRFRRDQITDNAAALTYYSLLSLFPALLFCAALLGVFGQQGLIDDATTYLRDAGAPADTVDAVTGALKSAQQQRGTAGASAGAQRFVLLDGSQRGHASF